MAEEFASFVPEGLPFSLETWRATPKEVRDFTVVLMKRLETLEERVNTNSKNSSAPPSSDRPGSLPNRKKHGGGSRGGQRGHKGHHRALLPMEQVTSVQHLVPDQCQHCGTSLEGQPTREK